MQTSTQMLGAWLPALFALPMFWKEEGFADSAGCFGILGPCDLQSPEGSTEDPVRTSCLRISILFSCLEASERGLGPRQSE